MKTIQITVASSGETTLETTGFEGSTCREASAFLERALGRTTQEQITSAYYSVPCESPPLPEKA